MPAKNHWPGVARLCQQRGSENKNSSCPTKRDNSEATCLLLLQIARLGKEVSTKQALRIAVDVRDGVVVMVVPEIQSCSELPLTQLPEDSLCRRGLSWPYNLALYFKLSMQRCLLWPYNWRYTSAEHAALSIVAIQLALYFKLSMQRCLSWPYNLRYI